MGIDFIPYPPKSKQHRALHALAKAKREDKGVALALASDPTLLRAFRRAKVDIFRVPYTHRVVQVERPPRRG